MFAQQMMYHIFLLIAIHFFSLPLLLWSSFLFLCLLTELKCLKQQIRKHNKQPNLVSNSLNHLAHAALNDEFKSEYNIIYLFF